MTIKQIHDAFHHAYHYFDVGVLVAAVATFFGWLPDITAFFALVYLLIRIWETETVKHVRKRKKSR